MIYYQFPLIKLNMKKSEYLQKAIKGYSFNPLIGERACAFEDKDGNPWPPLESTVTKEWIKEYYYSFEYSFFHVIRVSLFLGIKPHNELFAKMELSKKLSIVYHPNSLHEPHQNIQHAVLTHLNLLAYLTTNFDDEFMENSLRSRWKTHNRKYCKSNPAIYEFDEESFLSDNKGYQPTKSETLECHLHHHDDMPHSMVLTEPDYIEFIMAL